MDFGPALNVCQRVRCHSAVAYRSPGKNWLGQTLPEGFREYLQPAAAVRGDWLDDRLQGLARIEGAEVIEIGEKGQVRALLGYQPQPWDTAHFGVACAKLGPMCLPSTTARHESEALLRALLAAAVDRAHAAGVRVLQRRLLASRFVEIGILEDLGFHMADNVVTLTAPLQEVARSGGKHPPGIVFRSVQARDREALVAMTRGAFPYSRFVTDRLLDSEKGQALYVAWLNRLIDATVGDDPTGRPGFVVACRGGVPVGYCTYRIDASIHADIGLTLAAIELIVVSPDARGVGLGTALLQAVARETESTADIMESSTWSGQKAALAANQNAGLKVRETLLTYHRYL